MVEGTVSDTRFKLQEADYFLNQIKNNIDKNSNDLVVGVGYKIK